MIVREGSLGSSRMQADVGLRLQAGHGATVVSGAKDLVEVHESRGLLDRWRDHPLKNVGRLLHFDGPLDGFLGTSHDAWFFLLVIDVFFHARRVKNCRVVVVCGESTKKQ